MRVLLLLLGVKVCCVSWTLARPQGEVELIALPSEEHAVKTDEGYIPKTSEDRDKPFPIRSEDGHGVHRSLVHEKHHLRREHAKRKETRDSWESYDPKFIGDILVAEGNLERLFAPVAVAVEAHEDGSHNRGVSTDYSRPTSTGSPEPRMSNAGRSLSIDTQQTETSPALSATEGHEAKHPHDTDATTVDSNTTEVESTTRDDDHVHNKKHEINYQAHKEVDPIKGEENDSTTILYVDHIRGTLVGTVHEHAGEILHEEYSSTTRGVDHIHNSEEGEVNVEKRDDNTDSIKDNEQPASTTASIEHVHGGRGAVNDEVPRNVGQILYEENGSTIHVHNSETLKETLNDEVHESTDSIKEEERGSTTHGNAHHREALKETSNDEVHENSDSIKDEEIKQSVDQTNQAQNSEDDQDASRRIVELLPGFARHMSPMLSALPTETKRAIASIMAQLVPGARRVRAAGLCPQCNADMAQDLQPALASLWAPTPPPTRLAGSFDPASQIVVMKPPPGTAHFMVPVVFDTSK